MHNILDHQSYWSLSVLCLDQTFNYIFIICIDICSFKINLLASMHFLFHMNFRIRLLGVPISFSKNVCTSISHPTCSSLHGSDIPAMRAWVCVSSSCIWVGLTGRREAMTIETVLKGNISFAASSWGACCQIPATILRGSQCPCGKAIWRCALPAPADAVSKLASISRPVIAFSLPAFQCHSWHHVGQTSCPPDLQGAGLWANLLDHCVL